MRKLILLFLATTAWATTTVTGKIQTLGTGNVTSGAFVRFWLRGCGGNAPRIAGTSVIAPSQGGVYFFDIAANGSGNISGTIYSTRDATGLLNGEIECGGSLTAVWYGMQVFSAGKGGAEIPIHAKNSATLDITNVTPITTNPVIASPTGDSTYARLDAGNQPFTGTVSPSGSGTLGMGTTSNRWNGFFATLNANGAAALSAGGTLTGTFGGSPTWTGNHIFSGANTFSGNNAFTVQNTFSAQQIFNANIAIQRLLPNRGTALVNGDGAFGGNWGTSPILGVTGFDSAFRITATSGSGSPGANPNVTLTFKDGAWVTAPVCVASRLDIVAPSAAYWAVDVTSQTTVRLTFVGTPSTSLSYIANVICVGQ